MSESLETTELFGPHGRMIVNALDVPHWRAKGYKTAEEVQKAKTHVEEEETQDAEPTDKLQGAPTAKGAKPRR